MEKELTEMEEYAEFVAEHTSENVGRLVTNPTFLKGWWAASGLNCEAGEVLELFEKGYRKGVPVSKDKLKDELGDCFWFLIAVCNAYEIDPDEMVEHNISKLIKRAYDAKETKA